MLAELIDLVLHSFSVVWLVFIGFILYTGWIRDVPDQVVEVHKLAHATDPQPVPVLTARSA